MTKAAKPTAHQAMLVSLGETMSDRAGGRVSVVNI